MFVSGQICCDCEDKLNTESVVLQGCINVSGGRATPTSIKNLSYSLFPGQVGNCFSLFMVVNSYLTIGLVYLPVCRCSGY